MNTWMIIVGFGIGVSITILIIAMIMNHYLKDFWRR